MTEAAPTPIEKLLAIRTRAHVRRGAFGSQVLRQLLTELHASSMLPGGIRIARNACTLLRSSLDILPREKRPIIKNYIRELRWMIRHSRRLACLLFRDLTEREHFLRCAGSNPVLRVGAKEHGLWCLLWERHPDRALFRPFRSLQQQALLAHFGILRHWINCGEWEPEAEPADIILSSLYSRTLAIRHFSMARYASTAEHRSALSRMPQRATPTEHIASLRRLRNSLILSTLENAQSPRILEDVVAIIGLLKCAEMPERFRDCRYDDDDADDVAAIPQNQDRPKIPDTPPDPPANQPDIADYEVTCIEEPNDDEGGPIDEEKIIVGEDDNQSDDEEDEQDTDSSITTYTRHRWTDEEKKACFESGTHPADALTTSTLRLSDRKSGGSRGWAEMENQLLRCSWKNLAMEEVADGMEILRRAADRGGIPELELFALAQTILARGLKERAARSFVVRSDYPLEVDVVTLVLPIDEVTHGEWLIPAVPIPLHNQRQDPHPGCRLCEKFFGTPDYWNVGAVIRKLINFKFPEWHGQSVQPFADPAEPVGRPVSYSLRLKYCLTREDPDKGESLKDRFTFPRLGRILFQRIGDQTQGNIVLATYVTQQTHPCGEVTRYYDTPPINGIQTADRRALAGIQEELFAVGYCSPIDLTLKTTESVGYVGSPFCPTIESVRTFLSATVNTIIEAGARLNLSDDLADMIIRHNAYTVYTYVGVTLGTCHRPTEGGIPDMATVDEDSRMLSIIDKGADKARLSVAADAAVAQLGAYHDYVNGFNFEKYLGEIPTLSFFFIAPNGEVLTVKPSSLKEHLPYVANFARHLARTVLAEWCEQGDQRISPERLNALLGHAAEGEQQYGPHSTFDYAGFCNAMRSALGDLLIELGFQPINIQGEDVPVHDPRIQRILNARAA